MRRPLIGLALSAVCFVLAFGLCGFGAGNKNGGKSEFLIGAGLLGLALGAIGGIVCVIWLVIALIRGEK